SAPTGEVLLEVAAHAPPWVDVSRAEAWVNGKLVAKTALQSSSKTRPVYRWREVLELEEDSWIVVIVRGDRPLGETFPEAKGTPLAIVNPVFVDVDGDGVFRPRLARLMPDIEEESAPGDGYGGRRTGAGNGGAVP